MVRLSSLQTLALFSVSCSILISFIFFAVVSCAPVDPPITIQPNSIIMDNSKNSLDDDNHAEDLRVEQFFSSHPFACCPKKLDDADNKHPEEKIRVFSRAEIQKHIVTTNLWIVMRGCVLDVSSFVEHHPGGRLILKGSSEHVVDAASLFTQFHQPATTSLFENFCIGKVES